jgi:hypothetical protein
MRRRHELGIDGAQTPTEPQTWADLRRHKTLDSGISGALAGGLLRGWKCESPEYRIHRTWLTMDAPAGRRAVMPGALTIGAVCTLLQLGYNEFGILRLRYLSNLNGPLSVPKESNPPVSKSSSERLMSFLGMKPVTDEEYIQKLKIKRDGYLKQIAELEQKLAAENEKSSSR